MIVKNSGFILLTVLIFLMIFSVLTLSALALSQLQIKISNNIGKAQRDFQQLDSGLRLLETKFLNSSVVDCLVDQQDKPWLTAQPCKLQINDQPISYVLEALPNRENTCILEENRKFTALNYRITVWNDLGLILQSRIITAGEPHNTECTVIDKKRYLWLQVG